ncbi:uncharacterized protein LOC123297577 isoform X2 [Chrysoperla carnea]|uniref:uncharacterized protein LOC123297577 isoform X2 n=1 Tax=Chrysoperla carnea TaxID=189513 RepID=UPI001D078F8D|nr:uncharacterized protein LOC123297577 isoform X2 [Chrysoperla carnea]
MCEFNKLVLSTVFCIMAVNPVLTGYSWIDSKQQWKQLQKNPVEPTHFPLPEFDMTKSSQVSVLEGQIAYLPCVVRNLGDRVVSWIRTKDLHILTSDIHQYTSDTRFETMHPLNSDTWALKINATKLTDSGFYECQVNTDPKIKFPVVLTVIDSDQLHDSPYKTRSWGSDSKIARISGPREQYVRVGSTVTFTCEVSPMDKRNTNTGSDNDSYSPSSTLPSSSNFTSLMATSTIYPRIRHAPIVWTHQGRLVSFQAARGGISMDTDYSDMISTSRLTISRVTTEDAGDYTCVQGDTKPATVILKLEESEHTEAMQRDMAMGENKAHSHQISQLLLFYIVFLLYIY